MDFSDLDWSKYFKKKINKISQLTPRDYQEIIVDHICSANDSYGRIISLETGLGKTFISLMFLCKKLDIDYTRLKSEREIQIHKAKCHLRSKIVFLVPTKNLLEQQCVYFRKYLPNYFDVFSVKNSSEYSEGKKVLEGNERPIFVVMIHKVCLTLMRSGSINIEEINFLVFDECHHTQKEHPYNLIMREFYFYGLDFNQEENERYKRRPYILGLTASPIKNKIKQADRLEFRFEMMDQMKELCSNMNSKIVSIDMSKVDDGLVRKLKTDFIEFKMEDYWKSLTFAHDPAKIIPNLREIIEECSDKYEINELSVVFQSLEIFDKEFMNAMKSRHKLMGFSSMTPEKVTQVIGNTYKDTLKRIKFEDFPDEIRVALIMTIAFYVYSDNILMNVGVWGLKIFIEDLCSRFKYDISSDKTGVMNKYLKEWKECVGDLKYDFQEKDLNFCPKLQQLINNFFKRETFNPENQIIIFVDQRLIADLLYRTLSDLIDSTGKNIIDVVYSHGNPNLFKKIFKKTKIDSDKILGLFDNILNLEQSYGRSLK